jgi:predicted unusual protein kinase regulating ubiquinone biosynthesis (AarF/ABC1/UbiB family)
MYRARRIGTTFSKTYLGIRAQRFVERRLRPRDMAKRWSRFNRRSAESIYDTAIELQGLILKGCQFLGTRADVVPREYVEVLSRLHDRVPPRPFATIRESVERELDRPLEKIFARFDEVPIAAASLAQVHRARLHDGCEVAVKVQYPEIEALVHSDLSNLRALFKAVGLLEREFDLMPLVEELGIYVPRELNFANEGRNAETIARYFADRDDIAVPRIHWDVTSERILVMDFVDGIKVDDARALRAAGVDTDAVARTLVEAYCEQILRRGFFHADPHPGNILVQPTDGAPRIVFLDFGLAKDLPPHFREGVLALAAATLRGNADDMARALVALGFETRDGDPASLLDVAHFVLQAAQQLREHSHLDREMTERIREELPERIRQNPIVRMPSHLMLVGRVVGLLSGLNRTLETRVDFARAILPYALGTQDRAERSAGAPAKETPATGTVLNN